MSLNAIAMEWRTSSLVGFSAMTFSSSSSASAFLPILCMASAISTFAHCRSGCFLSTRSASWRAFLLFPLSSQSAKKRMAMSRS